jgi:hypothetical protein
MKKIAILTVLVFILSVFTASVIMAQAKPAAGKASIKIGAIYDFAGPCYM